VPRGADCQSDYQSAPYIHASVFPGARGAPRRLRGDRVSSPARRGAQPLPTRRRSRGRPARAPGIAHAMDLAAFPLAAGAPHRACPAAALGRAGLEVGPHEHLAGRTSHRRGDLRDDRTRPEQGEHRGGQPPSCSERYSHAHSSLSARTQGRGHSSLRLYKSNRPGEGAMRVPRRVAAGCNLGAWDQTSVRDALREKGTTEVQRGLYLLHVPCTVYRLGGARWGAPSVRERPLAERTQCPGTPAGPGRKRNTW